MYHLREGSGRGPVMGYYNSGLSTRTIAAAVTQLYPGSTAWRGDSVFRLQPRPQPHRFSYTFAPLRLSFLATGSRGTMLCCKLLPPGYHYKRYIVFQCMNTNLKIILNCKENFKKKPNEIDNLKDILQKMEKREDPAMKLFILSEEIKKDPKPSEDPCNLPCQSCQFVP
ncbi:hypothetical protein AVEN_29893-1 [Araneus ventricosus]|uniref:Uncharacterized protein n=1 Tax=Araneus ventricosus TaxID=182803 RepID=A0A4Y2JQG5_ARAVE|nr:hypothetical protein AVEN_29893-1 [Araneus ventricosus]